MSVLPVALLAVSLLLVAVTAAGLFLRSRQRSRLAESLERERVLRTILDTVDVGIVALDKTGHRLLTNRWQSELEASAVPAGSPGPAQEAELLLAGHAQQAPLPPERRPIRRAAAGETFADYLVSFGGPPGARVVSTGARSLTDHDGGCAGAVVLFNEVTGLMEALAAKDDVVSTVSHEFRNPLTSIIGNLDLALSDPEELPAQAVRRIEVAQRNAERLLALVSDLLMSANSAVHVRPRRTDVASLVEASLGSAHAHARSASVALSMDVPGPLWANLDPLRISQALDNLVSNAIKYSPDGGTVRVSASTEGGTVRLLVQDDGIGMTAADAEKVFTRFYRSPAVREGPIPGAGLGLSITKAIVEHHGGTVSCSTRPGLGSTFTVELPTAGPSAS
ncbi:ATP-binding protein [Arthrobacter sp. UYCu712]|uniref:ATP-binding protein n=1 Tax=Arthrobacter sp. UYCu712 TaxID=3156340 RepID=UPI003393C878